MTIQTKDNVLKFLYNVIGVSRETAIDKERQEDFEKTNRTVGTWGSALVLYENKSVFRTKMRGSPCAGLRGCQRSSTADLYGGRLFRFMHIVPRTHLGFGF